MSCRLQKVALAAGLLLATSIFANIKVGVLHSLSGTMMESERPVVEAVHLAVEEINNNGGVLGQKIEIVTADGGSKPEIFAKEARRLISKEKVNAIFGCWTSASRKAVKPVVEEYDNLLFYPVQYEGLEMSKNIFYTGMVANQQIFPAVKWASKNFGHKFFLVGSDYIFPRTANLILRDLAGFHNAVVMAERYLPLGSSDVKAVVDEIAKNRPDVVFNTINGDTNKYFFMELIRRGLADIPVVSFSVGENEMVAFGGSKLSKHYAVWNYFQSIDSAENRKFVKAFRDKFGQDRVLSDPMKAAYSSVYMWARAVNELGDSNPKFVNRLLMKQSIKSPAGIAAIDYNTRHVWQDAKIGKVLPNGQFEIVYKSKKLIRPNPYPIYKSRQEWDKIIKTLERGGN